MFLELAKLSFDSGGTKASTCADGRRNALVSLPTKVGAAVGACVAASVGTGVVSVTTGAGVAYMPTSSALTDSTKSSTRNVFCSAALPSVGMTKLPTIATAPGGSCALSAIAITSVLSTATCSTPSTADKRKVRHDPLAV